LPVIGFIGGLAERDSEIIVPPFRRGIAEQGYVEGRNVEILYRYPEIQYRRMPELVAGLVSRRVAVIFAFGTPAAVAAKAATTTIPIVFAIGVDPIQSGPCCEPQSSGRQCHRCGQPFHKDGWKTA
jgi:putative ABC transport system substrate-binding protein